MLAGALFLAAYVQVMVAAEGLSAKYPGDAGIGNDPEVLFADNFESGDMKKWDQQRGRVVMTEDKPNSGRWCVQMPMERGKNHGGDAIKWFMPGADAVYARFYVKFSPDYQYNHHFVWLGANQRTNKWSAFGKAGLKPNGTYYSTGMEPWFAWGKNPPPGEVNLYTYYLDMEPDRKMDKYWGNGFFPPGPGKGTAAGAAPRHSAAESMAVLGVHDPGEHRAGQSRRQTSDVGGWKVGRRIHRHPLAQRPGFESELLLARTLRLRRGRPDQTILERQPVRLVRRRRRGPPLHRADEQEMNSTQTHAPSEATGFIPAARAEASATKPNRHSTIRLRSRPMPRAFCFPSR